MKITCEQNDLLKGLQISTRAVPSKTTMSILECVLIDASSRDIRLTANDTELGIETIIPGHIEAHGKVCLDAKIFYDMVRNLPNNIVTIEVDDKDLTKIKCEKANFVIHGKSGDDFPYLPVIPRNDPIKISQLSLREIINQTIFSISTNDVKRVLTGELFTIKGDRLRVCSLDGHRISIRNLTLRDSYRDLSVIIPGKALGEVAKILSGSADDLVYLFITENHAIFDFDSTTVITRLIEGTFFDVDRMLSEDYETKVTVNRRDFMESISRSILLVSETEKKPILFDVSDQTFKMRISTFRGNFDEEISMIKEGRDLKIAFNPKFIHDALRAIDDENVSIYLLSPTSPCFIRNESMDYVYVILPVNFN